MAAEEVTEKKQKLTNHKSIKRLKKKNSDLLEIQAHAASDADGEHPLFAVLKKCGYFNCMMTHGEIGVTQAGSYRPAYLSQRAMDFEPFDVYVQDEAGFVLPRDDENVLKDQTNLNTILTFREYAKKGQAAMLALKSIAWEKRGWKVVNRQEKSGDKGGMLACTTVKLEELVTKGYYLAQDENGADYWQLYNEDGSMKDGEFTYTPNVCHDVVAGEKYHVINDQVLFDSVATKSGTPYDANVWAELSRDVLGWEVTVENIILDGDWPGYNVVVSVEHTEGGEVKSHTIPIRALRKKDPEATALMMGEVGMFVITAELKLFPSDGKNPRGKSIQPLVSEFKGVLESLGGQDDAGYMDIVDAEEDEGYANLKPDIQAWCQAQTDWSYDNY